MESRQKRTDKEVASKGHGRDKIENVGYKKSYSQTRLTGSRRKTLFACVRLIPTAPARTDSRNTVVGGSFENAWPPTGNDKIYGRQRGESKPVDLAPCHFLCSILYM